MAARNESAQRMSICVSSVGQIYYALHHDPSQWPTFINLARSVMSSLDALSFMSDSRDSGRQIYLIEGLQRLAYHDPDEGRLQDIATWCQRQWLTLLEHDANNVEALRGLGQNWLWMAQPLLAQIHRESGSSSSEGSGWRTNGIARSYSQSDDDREAARTAAEAERRTHSANYVEARGILLPATEYFSRAIEAAENQGQISGTLLASAAEAYMSLGNVSSSRVAEEYFGEAVRYLRRAQDIEGYALSSYLQHYLDDYGRLVD